MIFLELFSRKQDHQKFLENILQADGFDGETESFDLGDQVFLQLPVSEELSRTLAARTIPGVTIGPDPFKSDKSHFPLVAKIECRVIQRSHTLIPDIGSQFSFGLCTIGLTVGLRTATDEGEEVILSIKDATRLIC